MVVVESRPIGQDPVSLNFDKGFGALLILLLVRFFIRVFMQNFCSKPSFIPKRVFTSIVPHWTKIVGTITFNQLNRLVHRISVGLTFDRNTIFGFNPKKSTQSLDAPVSNNRYSALAAFALFWSNRCDFNYIFRFIVD